MQQNIIKYKIIITFVYRIFDIAA